jgi:hypothetical protein
MQPGGSVPTDSAAQSAAAPTQAGAAGPLEQFAARPAEQNEAADGEAPDGPESALFSDLDYITLRRRIWRIYVMLVIGGTIGCAADGNRERAIGFLGGCAVSGLSFFLLERLVADLGTALEGKRPRAASVLAQVFRLLLLGGATFAIVKLYGAPHGAVAAGLLAPVSAILLEVVYELIYARA